MPLMTVANMLLTASLRISSSSASNRSLCNNTLTGGQFVVVDHDSEKTYSFQADDPVGLDLLPSAQDHPAAPGPVSLGFQQAPGSISDTLCSRLDVQELSVFPKRGLDSSCTGLRQPRLRVPAQYQGLETSSMYQECYAVGIPTSPATGPAFGHEEFSDPRLHDPSGLHGPNPQSVSLDMMSHEAEGSQRMFLASPTNLDHLTPSPLSFGDSCAKRQMSMLGFLEDMGRFDCAFSTSTDMSNALTGQLNSTPANDETHCLADCMLLDCPATDLGGCGNNISQCPAHTFPSVDLQTQQGVEDVPLLRADNPGVVCMDSSRPGTGDYSTSTSSIVDAVLRNDATPTRHSVLRTASISAPADDVGSYGAQEERDQTAEDSVGGDDENISVPGQDSASEAAAAIRSSGSVMSEDRQGCSANGTDTGPYPASPPQSAPSPDPRPQHAGVSGKSDAQSTTLARNDDAEDESEDDLDLNASEATLLLACLRRKGMLHKIIKQLGHQQKSKAQRTQHSSESGRPAKSAVKCDHCPKMFARSCELKKHMKRHEKPYGCTFPRCKKSFGSKNDWKRHENSQHYQLEFWRCEEEGKSGVRDNICGKLSHSRDAFRTHLGREHGVTDTALVERQCQEKRLGRNCEARFWCGFCRKTIEVTQRGGGGAWSERFDHIEPHFLGTHGREKKGIKEWVHVDPDLPDLDFPLAPDVDMARLRHQREESPEGLDDNVLEAGLTAGLSSLTACRKRSGDEDASGEEAAKREPRDFEQWHCVRSLPALPPSLPSHVTDGSQCSCGSVWDVTSSSLCQSGECSNHERCSNCMISSQSFIGEPGARHT